MSEDQRDVQFKCLKCGQCCRKLIGRYLEETTSGLALFPEEIEYFPREMISPFRGKGKYPEDRSFRIYMYQLNREPCPNIIESENTSRCAIYPNRPLICQCYPFTVLGWLKGELLTHADPACTAFKEVIDSDIEVQRPQSEWEACLSYALKVGFLDLNESYWIFDLEDNEWHVSVPPVSYVERYISRLVNESGEVLEKPDSVKDS